MSNQTCKAASPRGVREEGVGRLQAWMLSLLAATDNNTAVITCVTRWSLALPRPPHGRPRACYREWVSRWASAVSTQTRQCAVTVTCLLASSSVT